jgi:histidyl-tRNA synthetase
MAPLSTDPYKGVRDFYPEDLAVQDFIFAAMRRAARKFGYEEYAASVLEPTELYASKTSDEIVSEQTYTFTDRGDRSVTLRPEMTPTAARMVAARKRELAFPVRWFSIPNVFRYERPQRGRLREHWQLNCDLFGPSSSEADAEIIALSHAVMTELGATQDDFEIRLSDRTILSGAYDAAGIPEDARRKATRLLDQRAKMDDVEKELSGLVGAQAAQKLLAELDRAGTNGKLEHLRALLAERGVRNARIDTSITRGFDYYTGMVFEVYDTDETNKRSMFGGGRFDKLMELFGEESVPAVGFGMGDVTARDFLEAHGLLPAYRSATDIYIAALSQEFMGDAERLAEELREKGVNAAVGLSEKKVGDQVKIALKKRIPFFAALGEAERGGTFRLKELKTQQEHEVRREELADRITAAR